MIAFITYFVFLISLVHVFLFAYNRVLLCLSPSAWKLPLHYAWFVLSVLIPGVLVLVFYNSEEVQSALNWEPVAEAKTLFVIMVASIAFLGTRGIIWLQERFFVERPQALMDEKISRPAMPSVASALPRPLRVFETTGDLVLTEREIAVTGLAPAFDGLTIAQVSDIHFGARLEMENYLEAVRELVAGLQADIVVFTGDFVDRRKDIVRAVEYHSRFRGRLGTLCVLGNHDYWTRPDRIFEELGKTSIKWLGGGERRTLKRHGRRLIFTGTDAPWDGAKADFDRTIRRGTGDCVVLLSHTPDNAPRAARAGASLILSGHNHGGQICLPVIGPVVVPSKHGLQYSSGLFRVGADSLLNVSRGVGVSSGGIRVLCPPEVCLLTLRVSRIEVMVGRAIQAREVFRPARIEQATGEGFVG
ncbi:hypothetical protein BH09SUM1_BH09SUM1_28720 [soil metagenome]